MRSSWAGKGWSVAVEGEQLEAVSDDDLRVYASANANQLALKRRWFRWVLLADGRKVMRLP